MDIASRVRELKGMVAQLAIDAKIHTRGDDAVDSDLHIGAMVIEELTGTIDSSNKTFTSTYVPTPGTRVLTLCIARGAFLERGNATAGYTQAGRAWHLATAPHVSAHANDFTDMRPIAVYLRDPRVPVPPDLEPGIMDAVTEDPRRYPHDPYENTGWRPASGL